MTAPAAIKATFSDFKVIRGRKVCQIVCEIPIEEADAALAALGGIPNPVSESWLALARLNVGTSAESPTSPPKERRRFSELPPSQQSALKCGDLEFRQWLGVANVGDAAAEIRYRCGVESRSDLDTDPDASAEWQHILRQFNERAHA